MTIAPTTPNLPLRIDLGFVNAYLLRAAKGFVLLDTGTPGLRKRLQASLVAAGCQPGQLSLVILSHGDPDHTGNAAWLRQEYGAKIAIHAADREALETGVMPKRKVKSALVRLLLALTAPFRGRTPSCSPDLELVEGQDLGAFGLAARLVHLPGHTPGSIGLLLEGGDFIAGDVLANWKRPAPSPFIHDVEAYRATLALLARLLGGETRVWPGHGPMFLAKQMGELTL